MKNKLEKDIDEILADDPLVVHVSPNADEIIDGDKEYDYSDTITFMITGAGSRKALDWLMEHFDGEVLEFYPISEDDDDEHICEDCQADIEEKDISKLN